MGVRVRRYRGAWWIFVAHHGKRWSKKVVDEATAHRLAGEIAAALTRSDLGLLREAPAPPPPPETVGAYATAWLATAPIKESTRRFYQDNLTNHLIPALGPVGLAEIRRSHVKALVVGLQAKGLKPATLRGILRTLSTVLSEAVDDDKLAANPALRPGRLERRLRDPNALQHETIDPYTADEVERLLAAARGTDWYPFLLTAVRSGLRLGELRALAWDAIDWQERFLDVCRNFVEGRFTSPKNHERRHVDLSLQLRAELRLWRRRQRARWWQVGRPLPALVFPTEIETVLDDSRIRKAMVAIARKAEVRVRRSPVHVLRHTFASLLIQHGESLVYVRDQLGHHSITVTADIYGHLIPGGNKGAVDRLDRPVGQVPAASQLHPAVRDLVSQDGIEPSTRRLRERVGGKKPA